MTRHVESYPVNQRIKPGRVNDRALLALYITYANIVFIYPIICGQKILLHYPIFVPQFGQNFGGLAGSGNGWPQFVQKAAAAACGFGLPQFGQNLPVFTLPQEHVHVSPLWMAGLAAC